MPNRPNEFVPPPPREIPEWAEYRPKKLEQFGYPVPSNGGRGTIGGRTPVLPAGHAPGYSAATAYTYPSAPMGGPGAAQIPFAPVQGFHAPTNSASATALVFGVLAVTYGITVFGGLLFGPMAILAGLVGLNKAKKTGGSGRAASQWGLWLGVAGTCIGIFLASLPAAEAPTKVYPRDHVPVPYERYQQYGEPPAEDDSF